MANSVRLLAIGLLFAPLLAFAQEPVKVVVEGETPATTTPAITGESPEPPKVILTPEAAAQVSAVDRARADEMEREGNKLFSAGRYREAIEQFRQAYEITQGLDLLYSIGMSYQNLEAWQDCVTQMEQYLERAPVGPKRDRADNTRKSCEARIERDQQIVIESDPVGASVYFDDKSRGVVGTTPYRNYVKPGPHKVWVELPGFEPVYQDIEVQKKEPFRLSLVMTRAQNLGWIFIDSTVIDARVYIDGKNIGLTPFKEPIAYPAGRVQVIVERDGYTRYNEQVPVSKGLVKIVDAHLVRTDAATSWRTPLGWTTNVFGLLAIAGGVVAWQFAEEEYNDTDKFDEFAGYEKLGYGVGGGLLAVGTALIVWDALRDEILDADRNHSYGNPVRTPTISTTPVIGVLPGGLSVGFGF